MKNITFSIFCLTLVLAACRKDVDEFVPYGSSIAELEQLLGEIPDPNTETVFSFSGGISDTFLETASGVRIKIFGAENLFVNENDVPVPASTCLDLQIHIKEYIKLGDIVAAGIPLNPNGELPEDISGLIELEVFCSGSPLQIAPNQSIIVNIPSDDVTVIGQKSDLNLHFADRDINGDISLWTSPVKDTIYLAEWTDISGVQRKGFEITIEKTGLFGGFKFPTNTLGKICTDIPSYYTADNTMSFLFFTDGKSALPMAYDSQDKKFCIDGIPVGLPAKVVLISKLGDQWQYVEEPILTETDQEVQMTQLNTTRESVLDSMRDF